jgi:potassium-transporting ATPase KdpC subunit
MRHILRAAVVVFAALTFMTGIVYPTVITFLAQGIFPYQANGSLIRPDEQAHEHDHINLLDWRGAYQTHGKANVVLGSELIGQEFRERRYFWGRPSATSPVPYNGAASTGSNLGPTNEAQLQAVRNRIDAVLNSSPDYQSPIPIDLVTASASGLDPHISPAAADYQVPRVAIARGVGEYVVRRLVAQNIEGRTWGVLGEPRVSVLRLNLALDELKSETAFP